MKWKFITISQTGSGSKRDCEEGFGSDYVTAQISLRMITELLAMPPHELRSFGRGCRRIGPKLYMIFCEQAPENQSNFVPAWLVVFAKMV